MGGGESMGLLDRFRKKKQVKAEEGAKYVLTRKGAKGGFEKVMDLARMMSPEELFPQLVPGVYVVHKYEKGSSGFTESGPVFEVTGDEAKEGVAQPVRGSPFAGLREFAEEMRQTKEDLTVALETLAPMVGFVKPGESKQKSLIEQIKEAKADQQTLNDAFPLANTSSQQIPISGSIPAVVAYAPTLIDQSMDSIEKRLKKWGLVEEAGAEAVEHKDVIKMPEKPTKAMEKKAEEETKKEESEAGTLKLPPKPEAKEEVKKVDIEEEKKGEEEKEDGKRTEKSGK
jgi:hypothetical protein